ncbi:uncharacterized protein LOC119324003 [Triticum dicoccoides]|uniref:uncharacterized protein LOC119324003 n=1 Tax=Triticum dicoccoides TaxID=85692 RepID=UPI00188F6361|nr:uncharacterized protein LOC119324003 [Triticum dicoccoides]
MSCECSLTRVVKPMDNKRLFDGERIYAHGDYLKCARIPYPDPLPDHLPHPHRQRPTWHRPAAGAMTKKPLRRSAAVRHHGVLPTYSLAARLDQGLTNEQATSSLLHTRSNRQIYKMAAVKQEEVDTTNDTSGGQITHDEPLRRKHNKRYEYIHRPRKASSIQKFKGKKIHLKPRKFILRGKNYITLPVPSDLATTTEKYNFVQFNIGEPCEHYLDEFSHLVVWGNTVRLYNHNVRALQKIIHNTTTPNNYYVCHMTETFATQGKRMVILRNYSVLFHIIAWYKMI